MQLKKKKLFKKNENIDRTVDLEETWEFICNKRMLAIIRSLIGEKVSYLHDAAILISSKNASYGSTWHRDCPCRRTGIGPDWNTDEEYKVLRAIAYLDDDNSSLNVIKQSHNKKYKSSISNILRIIDSRLRKFPKLSFIKNLIIKLIGTHIEYNTGDLVLFYTTLYHTGKKLKDSKDTSYMSSIIAAYGGEGSHTKRFLNYEMNYRMGLEKYDISKKKDILFKRLMENEIYISPETKKDEIEGMFLPKNQESDSVYLKDKA